MTVDTQLIQEREDRGLTRRDGHREARTDVQLSLVIPVYNGVGRLPLMLEEVRTFLEHHRELGEVVFVDDGSSDDTASLLRAFVADVPRTRLIALPRNRGKGYAVRRGMLAARGAFRIFTDADLAYPLEDLEGIVLELQRGADVVVACRVLPQSRYLMSPAFFPYLFTRHLASRAYNAVVRWTLLPGLLDSQAGLKGMSARAARVIFPRLRVAGFGFDVEALYVALRHRLTVRQVPVFFRYNQEPSTVHFLRDSLRMIADLVTIRWNGARGRYD